MQNCNSIIIDATVSSWDDTIGKVGAKYLFKMSIVVNLNNKSIYNNNLNIYIKQQHKLASLTDWSYIV